MENINKEIKVQIDQEKEKLSSKIKELEQETDEKGKLDREQALLIYKNFSFDWDNLKEKVYKTDDGIAIIGWGLCDDLDKRFYFFQNLFAWI